MTSSLRFFVDRSPGDHLVPDALRRAEWTVVSMRERYGATTAEQLADIEWIPDASAQVFALGSSQLTGEQKAARFIRRERAIMRRAAGTADPYVISVTGQGREVLTLFG